MAFEAFTLIVLSLISTLALVQCAPKLRIAPQQNSAQLMTLPNNATSIRASISDSFSCEGRDYGYYADVENDCQIFHVCLPITYSDGRNQTFRWSFICPEETVFSQEMFTCTHADEVQNCEDSPRFYELNLRFGDLKQEEEHSVNDLSYNGLTAPQISSVSPVIPGEGNFRYRYPIKTDSFH